MSEKINSESRLTFIEATSIIIGHGVGSGILAVPFLASRNTWWDFLWIVGAGYIINLILHYMIAELSYNNGGAQFIKCLEKELFTGKSGKYLSWGAFLVMGLSELVKISGFIAGSSAVFESWLGLPAWAGMIIYYLLAAAVVYAGMKVVGICEKVSVFSMVFVIGILAAGTLKSGVGKMPSVCYAPTNLMALYGMIWFSLSAVMSVPQVVKGLDGDFKKIKGSIAAGTGINLVLIVVITFITIAGTKGIVTKGGALVDLSKSLGGWVSIIGYLFTLLALSTSFWANTLNLRDIVHEQTNWNIKLCWLLTSLPCLIIAMTGAQSFVGFTRLAGVVSVLTGIGIVVSYGKSRKRSSLSPICSFAGNRVFQVLVITSSVLATVGSVLSVK